MREKALLWLLVAVPLCLSEATLAEQSQASAPHPARTNRKPSGYAYHTFHNAGVRNLLGMRVENEDGQPMGNLDDLIVDTHSGQLVYALLSSGGFLGWHKQLRIVPPRLLSSATAKRGVLELDLGNLAWQRAPRFTYKQLKALETPDQERRIYHYYNQELPTTRSQVGRQTGKLQNQPSKRTLQLASQILGKSLLDRQGKPRGTVSDLLVDLKDGKPVLAVVSAGARLRADPTFIVALPVLRAQRAGTFVLDAPESVFAQAPPFHEQSWIAANAKGIAVYRLAEPNPGAARRQGSEPHSDLARQF